MSVRNLIHAKFFSSPWSINSKTCFKFLSVVLISLVFSDLTVRKDFISLGRLFIGVILLKNRFRKDVLQKLYVTSEFFLIQCCYL